MTQLPMPCCARTRNRPARRGFAGFGLLAAFGYQADGVVTETAVLGIRLVSGPIPALFLLAAVPLLLRYPVARAGHAQVRRDLSEPAEPGAAGEHAYWSPRG